MILPYSSFTSRATRRWNIKTQIREGPSSPALLLLQSLRPTFTHHFMLQDRVLANWEYSNSPAWIISKTQTTHERPLEAMCLMNRYKRHLHDSMSHSSWNILKTDMHSWMEVLTSHTVHTLSTAIKSSWPLMVEFWSTRCIGSFAVGPELHTKAVKIDVG